MANRDDTTTRRPVQVRGLSVHVWEHLIKQQSKLSTSTAEVLGLLFERTKTNDPRRSYEEAAEVMRAFDRALFEIYLISRKYPR